METWIEVTVMWRAICGECGTLLPIGSKGFILVEMEKEWPACFKLFYCADCIKR